MSLAVLMLFASFFIGVSRGDAFLLPDTGQTTCWDAAGAGITCPSSGSPLVQDGSYLINAPWLINNGNGTVTDERTGLLWQRGENPDVYTWYEGANWCGSLTIDGITDWRLPTYHELQSVFDYGIVPWGFNPASFPNVLPGGYWTATESDYDPSKAWLAGGMFAFYAKTSGAYVRCVSGGGAGLASLGDFSDNGNGTVTDASTWLTWQQNEAGFMEWPNALVYCDDLTLGAATDWRLPNLRELFSIVDPSRNRPATNAVYFPWTHLDYYWTSTTDLSLTSSAFTIGFWDGLQVPRYKANNTFTQYYVRCVRGGRTCGGYSGCEGHMAASMLGTEYATIQDALDEAGDTYEIKTWGMYEATYVHVEDLLVDFPGAEVILSGGWRCDFGCRAALSLIQGVLTISRGTLVIDSIAIM